MLDALWEGVRAPCSMDRLGSLTLHLQYAYWLLGAMCSTPEMAAKLVAVYKVTQGVGSAIAYQLTADNVSGRKQFISNWALIAGSLVLARRSDFLRSAEYVTH